MQLVFISGPPHSGKSAVAAALCQRYDRMLHIDVALLHEFLRMGRLSPWEDSPEGHRQRELFIGTAADMARRFIDAGYGVVIDDVILEDELRVYRRCLARIEVRSHFVVLLPALDVLPSREGRAVDRARALCERFAAWKDVAVIDPYGLAPEVVADRVMALAAEGRALLPAES